MNMADVLMAGKGIPVSDPLAALWGRNLSGGRGTPDKPPVTTVVCGKNLWSGKNLTEDTVIDRDDGTETPNENYVISDYFQSSSKLYTLSFTSSYEDWRIVSVALYDADKKFISLIRNAACRIGKWDVTFSTGGAAYFRVSLLRLDEEIQLETGAEATAYEPYSETEITN